MKYADWDAMATAAGVKRCRGILPSGHYCTLTDSQHKVGATTFPRIVHWADRPMYRSSIRRFVMLAAESIAPVADVKPKWVRLYMANCNANEVADKLHIRLPVSASKEDRAYVLSAIANVPSSHPLRQLAYRWAYRGREED